MPSENSNPEDNTLDFKIDLNIIVRDDSYFSKEYTVKGDFIGVGTYGKVKKALDNRINTLRAVKIIKINVTSEKDRSIAFNEIDILMKLDHPNIIKMYEYFQGSKQLYIVTELCTGGELFEKIQIESNISEEGAKIIMKQLLLAITYLHKKGIVHRYIFGLK